MKKVIITILLLSVVSAGFSQYVMQTLDVNQNLTVHKSIKVKGDNIIDGQRILIYSNDPAGSHARYGIGMGANFGSYTTRVFGDGGVSLGKINSSDGTTMITTFHTNSDTTRVLSTVLSATGLLNVLGGAIINGVVSIPGSSTLGSQFNAYNFGGSFKAGMNATTPGGGVVYTNIYAPFDLSSNGVRLGWMGSDGSTFNPVLSAFKNGTVTVPGLASGSTAPTTSGTIKNVVVDANGLLSFRDTVTGGGVSGSGTSGRVSYWNGSSSLTGDANYLYSSSNNGTLSIGTTNTQGHLNTGGNKNLSSSGANSYFAPATFTDAATVASGTANSYDINLIASPTIAATNSSVTFPVISTLSIVSPTAGTNATITKKYALSLSGAGANLGVGGFIDGITHLRSTGTGAAIAAGAGAGTGASGSVTGGDVAGKIDITLGTSPSTSATVVTITFNASYASAPTVILTPGNANAAALTGGNQVFVSSTSTTNFLVTSGSSGLSASTQYIWYYHVIQ